MQANFIYLLTCYRKNKRGFYAAYSSGLATKCHFFLAQRRFCVKCLATVLARTFDRLWLWAWGLLAFTTGLWLYGNASTAAEKVIECSATAPLPNAVAQAASAMAIWVPVVYLLLAVAAGWFGADFLSQAVVFSPLWAALLGLASGCGAQVLVTSLYLEGALPYAAQLANAVSNSGEALLPLLLVFPRLFWRVSFITFFLGVALAYLPWWW